MFPAVLRKLSANPCTTFQLILRRQKTQNNSVPLRRNTVADTIDPTAAFRPSVSRLGVRALCHSPTGSHSSSASSADKNHSRPIACIFQAVTLMRDDTHCAYLLVPTLISHSSKQSRQPVNPCARPVVSRWYALYTAISRRGQRKKNNSKINLFSIPGIQKLYDIAATADTLWRLWLYDLCLSRLQSKLYRPNKFNKTYPK